MSGQVLEIDCSKADVAVRTLRATEQFGEVVLYGALVHVVAEGVEASRPAIEQILVDAGLEVHHMQVIAPSLEDVFIASTREPA
jgi:hypothetical protein